MRLRQRIRADVASAEESPALPAGTPPAREADAAAAVLPFAGTMGAGLHASRPAMADIGARIGRPAAGLARPFRRQ